MFMQKHNKCKDKFYKVFWGIQRKKTKWKEILLLPENLIYLNVNRVILSSSFISA